MSRKNKQKMPVPMLKSDWMLDMTAGFAATVLGIVLTIGLSEWTEYRQNRKVIKSTVYNALTDLDNYKNYLEKDSIFYSDFAWLAQAINDNLHNRLNVDSISDIMNKSFEKQNLKKRTFYATGKNLLDQSKMQNTNDMETFRIINIAYENISSTQDFINEKSTYLSNLTDIWHEMVYSTTYFTKEEALQKILTNPSAHKLSMLMNETFTGSSVDMGFYAYSIEKIENDKRRIMAFAEINDEEYIEFKKERAEIDK